MSRAQLDVNPRDKRRETKIVGGNLSDYGLRIRNLMEEEEEEEKGRRFGDLDLGKIRIERSKVERETSEL